VIAYLKLQNLQITPLFLSKKSGVNTFFLLYFLKEII